jgi:hypothetical protein
MSDNIENELREMKHVHLSEGEMIAYCDQELDHLHRARVEAHVEECFFCRRLLQQWQEDIGALGNREPATAGEALVKQPTEQNAIAGASLQERLAEHLLQLVRSWEVYFKQLAIRGSQDEEEIWRWQSDDQQLQGHATLQKNGDVIVQLSSSELELAGVHIKVRIGHFSQETTLQRVSESEVSAKVTIPRQQRPRNMANISIEIV